MQGEESEQGGFDPRTSASPSPSPLSRSFSASTTSGVARTTPELPSRPNSAPPVPGRGGFVSALSLLQGGSTSTSSDPQRITTPSPSISYKRISIGTPSGKPETKVVQTATPVEPEVPLNELVQNKLVVSVRQKANPLLRFIKHVKFDIVDTISPDFIMSATACALFISLKFHILKPDYLLRRITQLTRSTVNVILCLVDEKEHESALVQLNALAVRQNFTLIVCWSNREAARYLETFRAYANKPPDAIKEREKETYFEQFVDVVTTVRAVNSTDALTLSRNFGSLRQVMSASLEQLVLCPGLGETKVKQLHNAFVRPFAAAQSKAKPRKDLVAFVARAASKREEKDSKEDMEILDVDKGDEEVSRKRQREDAGNADSAAKKARLEKS